MEGMIGEIRMFAGNFAPKNWAFCIGQTIAIPSNTALFSILGVTYGGNGTTTFQLPNFAGRAPVGAGQGPGLPSVTLGEMAGSSSVNLTVNEMPAHTHIATPLNTVSGTVEVKQFTSATSDAVSPINDYPAPCTNGTAYGTPAGTGTMGASNLDLSDLKVTSNITVGITGNNSPVGIMQPYLGMNYILCMYGIYPARN